MASRAKLGERLAQVADRSTLRLTHYGRKTGKPYEVTIWFVAADENLYLGTMNATRQWVRNVAKTPRVLLTMGEFEADGQVTRINAQRELGDPECKRDPPRDYHGSHSLAAFEEPT